MNFNSAENKTITDITIIFSSSEIYKCTECTVKILSEINSVVFEKLLLVD